MNNGIFVCLVSQNSPAALAGLRFGDQILSINDVTVAGYTMDQVHKMLRNAGVNGINVVIRDRLINLFLFLIWRKITYNICYDSNVDIKLSISDHSNVQ